MSDHYYYQYTAYCKCTYHNRTTEFLYLDGTFAIEKYKLDNQIMGDIVRSRFLSHIQMLKIPMIKSPTILSDYLLEIIQHSVCKISEDKYNSLSH